MERKYEQAELLNESLLINDVKRGLFIKFQDALSKASNVTVVHLIKVNSAKVTTGRVSLSSIQNRGEALAAIFKIV